MAKNLQIFKGGFAARSRDKDGNLRESRLVANQRPADGHIKPSGYEDYIRVDKHRFCTPPQLEAGDIIGIHTTLTFGIIEAWGIAVTVAEPGLKLKPVCSDPDIKLASLDFSIYKYDKDAGKYVATAQAQAYTDLVEVGHEEAYIAGYHKPGADLIRITNPVQLGFEVVSVPANGVAYTFEIESRLQMSQSVRPPACLGCC